MSPIKMTEEYSLAAFERWAVHQQATICILLLLNLFIKWTYDSGQGCRKAHNLPEWTHIVARATYLQGYVIAFAFFISEFCRIFICGGMAAYCKIFPLKI